MLNSGSMRGTLAPSRATCQQATRISLGNLYETLRETLRQIERRASKITDPAQRATYLAGRTENARVLLLARDGLGDEGAEKPNSPLISSHHLPDLPFCWQVIGLVDE